MAIPHLSRSVNTSNMRKRKLLLLCVACRQTYSSAFLAPLSLHRRVPPPVVPSAKSPFVSSSRAGEIFHNRPTSSPALLPRSKSKVICNLGSELQALGDDLLVFLASTVFLVPACKRLKLSPVLGFLGAGFLLGPYGTGLLADLADLNTLAELGITFLLFEQGLGLSLSRLKALSRYAFVLGTAQVVMSSLVFTIFPFVGGVQFLENIFNSPATLVAIERLDEAAVIGVALSLSSSAFVLKVLQEKKLMGTTVGSATLGVLLFQDIAVVPILVLLPILENQNGGVDLYAQASFLGVTVLKALGGLGGILVVGRVLLRRVFEIVAGARSSETFVGLCLLVAIGTGQVTEWLGLSSTLGAFIAGALLAETNYRTQVEADIAPFQGLLLGLFFLTTGATVDTQFLISQWPTVVALLTGLIFIKGIVTTIASYLCGLTPGESLKVGSVISPSGEFAFVVLTLARSLNVLPESLNKTLAGVVVLSMALTPLLAQLGDKLGDYVDKKLDRPQLTDVDTPVRVSDNLDLVVICGFGPIGQITASLIASPTVGSELGSSAYVAFDLNPRRVQDARRQGYPVFYGDGCEPKVLRTAGIENPKAILVTYTSKQTSLEAVKRLRAAFPSVPIIARAPDFEQLWKLREAGATEVASDLSETSLRMGTLLLEEFGGGKSDEVQSVKSQLRTALEEAARESGIVREFAQSYSPGTLSPATLARQSEMAIDAEELGVTVCLMPDRDPAAAGTSAAGAAEGLVDTTVVDAVVSESSATTSVEAKTERSQSQTSKGK